MVEQVDRQNKREELLLKIAVRDEQRAIQKEERRSVLAEEKAKREKRHLQIAKERLD